MESYFERLVERLVGGGYRWYETANFCRASALAGGRDLRSRHNLAYWRGRDYLGLGIGAVSTIRGERRRTTPRLELYFAALRDGQFPPGELELLPASVRRAERIMLGLRLDEPVPLAAVAAEVDEDALERLERLGLARRVPPGHDRETRDVGLTLTEQGRLLGDAVTADLLA
jgi:oxygen-independent coproporphyrinogen-3 oxidase